MDIRFFADAWKDENNSPAKEDQVAMWDRMAEGMNEGHDKHKEKNIDTVFDFLKSHNVIPQSKHILDLGCGPGGFSIEFGKEAEKVVALDISDNMLEKVEERKRKHDVPSVVTEKVFWDEVSLTEKGWDNHFDLVFASMSPAIHHLESLEKLIAATKKFGFFSAHLHRKSVVWSGLNEAIGRSLDTKMHERRAYYILNILWLKEIYPVVENHTVSTTRSIPTKELKERYVAQLEKEQPLTKEEHTIVDHFFQERDTEGTIQEETHTQNVWILFDVTNHIEK